MKESYVPKTPLLRKVKAEFWLISQNTKLKEKKNKDFICFSSIMYKFAGIYTSVTYGVIFAYNADLQQYIVCLSCFLLSKYIIYYYLISFFDFIIIKLFQVTLGRRNGGMPQCL